MAIPSKQIGWGTEENLLWQISKQLETLTKVTYNIGQTTTTTTTANPNCIQFVADTTSGGLNFGMSITASSETNYTIQWGDGSSDTGTVDTNFLDIQHTYDNETTAYNVEICFSNATLVTSLSFWGND